MVLPDPSAMLATLGGVLALVLGLTILLLPLVATELSRPRDAVWGAVVLLLGLVLVTSAERLTGAPMLGVLCGGLLIGRLGLEVGQSRWRVLSAEEQQRLWSLERWQTSLRELAASSGRLLELAAGMASGVVRWLAERRRPPTTTKRWVRQELPPSPAGETSGITEGVAAEAAAAAEEPVPAAVAEPEADTGDAVAVVSSLDGVEALLSAATPPEALDPPEAELSPPTGASVEEPTGREMPAMDPPETGAKRDNPGLPPEEP